MGWVSLLAGLVKIAGIIAGIIEAKQLMDAGAAKATAAGLAGVMDTITKAKRAADAVDNPASSADDDYAKRVRDRHTRPDA